ncbi:hypothetical protein EYF80_029229 [Liparis tanakae]|uniref:Uncharacterized protein n=1 Tax=Liparis tanakae TaxID=230148 RepID=A0A4Z2H3X6_9TELE|nr:hypothetical protein EYF80_029229 [Liparis tanakae]
MGVVRVEVHEAEREELQAHGEAVEQPEGERPERVGGHAVPEVEGEEEGAQGGPQQAQEQEGRLVAEALVPVAQHQPQLGVDEGEEQRVEDGVGDGQTQLHVRGDGRRDGGRGREVAAVGVGGALLLLSRVPLHRLPIHPPAEREGEREGEVVKDGAAASDLWERRRRRRRLTEKWRRRREEKEEEEGQRPSFCRLPGGEPLVAVGHVITPSRSPAGDWLSGRRDAAERRGGETDLEGEREFFFSAFT